MPASVKIPSSFGNNERFMLRLSTTTNASVFCRNLNGGCVITRAWVRLQSYSTDRNSCSILLSQATIIGTSAQQGDELVQRLTSIDGDKARKLGIQ